MDEKTDEFILFKNETYTKGKKVFLNFNLGNNYLGVCYKIRY